MTELEFDDLQPGDLIISLSPVIRGGDKFWYDNLSQQIPADAIGIVLACVKDNVSEDSIKLLIDGKVSFYWHAHSLKRIQ